MTTASSTRRRGMPSPVAYGSLRGHPPARAPTPHHGVRPLVWALGVIHSFVAANYR